jgi:TadE-like protein
VTPCPPNWPGSSSEPWTSRSRRREDRSREEGSATVETALVIPVLILVTVALCGVVSAMATQIRCVDAARLGARAAARGETDDAVEAAVLSAVPKGTRMTLARADGLVRVDVAAPAGGLPLFRGFIVHAEAEAEDEEAVSDEPAYEEP